MLNLQVADVLRSCRSLGPGNRAVIWVRGCSRRCPGCIAGPILAPGAGPGVPVEELARRVLSWPEIEGLTFSGGEPFEQAGALAALCERVRAERDLSLASYTGFTLEELQANGDPDQQRLLAQLDLLIDGPFVAAEQGDLLWRGSGNQRLHVLTARHADLRARTDDRSVGLEVHVRRDGRVLWAGVPPAGFQRGLERLLDAQGVRLRDAVIQTEVWS